MVTITICSNVECSNVKNIKGDCCPECGAKFIKIGMKELLNLIQNKNNTDPKKLPKSGFIACEKCGGYYKLKSGEYSANFTDKCDCGGKLIYINNIDVFKKNVTSKSEQTKNKVEPIAKQNDDENETKSIRSGGLLTNKKWYIIQENQRGKFYDQVAKLESEGYKLLPESFCVGTVGGMGTKNYIVLMLNRAFKE